VKKKYTFSVTISFGWLIWLVEKMKEASVLLVFFKREAIYTWRCLHVRWRDLGQYFLILLAALAIGGLVFSVSNLKAGILAAVIVGLALHSLGALIFTVVSVTAYLNPPELGPPTGANISTFMTRVRVVGTIFI